MIPFINGKNVCVFDGGNGFRVDLEQTGDEINVWLYHKDCGVKQYMLGLLFSQTDGIIDTLDIIERNLPDHIELYKNDYAPELICEDTRLDFCDDEEKMVDFRNLTKEEFLLSYSYLTEEEYDATARRVAKEEIKK